MGEIADMVLEGLLDEETCELIDGEAPGYPRSPSRDARERRDRALRQSRSTPIYAEDNLAVGRRGLKWLAIAADRGAIHSQAPSVFDGLAKRGLVLITHAEEDGRSFRQVNATGAGRALLASMDAKGIKRLRRQGGQQ